jgi:hypothetical protein
VNCPRCGSNNIEKTTIGFAPGHNLNRATCMACHARGVSQDWDDLAKLRADLAEALRLLLAVSGEYGVPHAESCLVTFWGGRTAAKCDCGASDLMNRIEAFLKREAKT